MNNSQWKLLRTRLTEEVTTILAPLNTANWNPETNRKANQLLSKRAEKLMGELNFPPIPEGHRLFARIWFNERVSPPKLKISVYHVPWNKGGARTSRSQPARKPIASPLKAEDPLGVIFRAADSVRDLSYEYVMGMVRRDGSAMLMLPMKLEELRRVGAVEVRQQEAAATQEDDLDDTDEEDDELQASM